MKRLVGHWSFSGATSCVVGESQTRALLELCIFLLDSIYQFNIDANNNNAGSHNYDYYVHLSGTVHLNNNTVNVSYSKLAEMLYISR